MTTLQDFKSMKSDFKPCFFSGNTILSLSQTTLKYCKVRKGHFHLCPRMDVLQTLHINNTLYTYYENVFISLDS